MGTPKSPLSQVALGGEGHGGGFEVPEGYQGEVHQHKEEASGGGMRWGGQGQWGGQGG